MLGVNFQMTVYLILFSLGHIITKGLIVYPTLHQVNSGMIKHSGGSLEQFETSIKLSFGCIEEAGDEPLAFWLGDICPIDKYFVLAVSKQLQL